MGQIIIVSGSPGTGKSTISRMLAENSPYERAVHIHTDDFYGYIRKGYIKPWLSEAYEQNTVIIESFVASVKVLAFGGYEVVVDGVVGSWFLEPWLELVKYGLDVRYVILRPSLEITILRNANRDKQVESNAVTHMWNEFSDLGLYESHVINSSCQSPEETAILIRNMLNEGNLRIK